MRFNAVGFRSYRATFALGQSPRFIGFVAGAACASINGFMPSAASGLPRRQKSYDPLRSPACSSCA
jgi:hypothetical protein